jgi:hypothetical protein
MGKYTALEKDIFDLVERTMSIVPALKVYPSNFADSSPESQFVRVTVIPGGNGLNLKSISGLLIADIYVPAGSGPRGTSLLADGLDSQLVGKSLKTTTEGVTQFGNSNLRPVGIDKDNPTLYRSTYTIPFNFFGV